MSARRRMLAALACLVLGAADVAAVNLRLAPRAVAGVPDRTRRVSVNLSGGPVARARDNARADGQIGTPGFKPGEFSAAPVLFAPNDAALDAEAVLAIDRAARLLGAAPGLRVSIEGHADFRGAEGRNRALSMERARAVAARLTRLGIAAGRIEVRGYGSRRPADAGTGPAALQRNRRVELRIGPGRDGAVP